MKRQAKGRAGESRADHSPGVRSVERAGRILEALLSAAPQGLRLGEIAERTDLHKSTALRLLRTLCDIRVVRKSADTERYRWDAIHWLAVAVKLRGSLLHADSLQGLLDGLAAKSGETVGIAYPDIMRREVIFVAVSLSRSPLRFDPGGTRSWPIHAAAAGKICLAHCRPEELATLRGVSLEAPGPRTITSVEKLLEEAEEARTRGYAVSREEGYAGAFGLAVPILDEAGDVAAALQLAAPAERSTEANVERWLGLLRAASQEVTRLLYVVGGPEGQDVASDARQSHARPRVVAPGDGGKKHRVV